MSNEKMYFIMSFEIKNKRLKPEQKELYEREILRFKQLLEEAIEENEEFEHDVEWKTQQLKWDRETLKKLETINQK